MKKKIPKWLGKAGAIIGIIAVIVSSMILPASADDGGGGFATATLESYNGLVEMQFYNNLQTKENLSFSKNATVGTPFSLYRLNSRNEWDTTDYFRIYYGLVDGVRHVEDIGFVHYIHANYPSGTEALEFMDPYYEDYIPWGTARNKWTNKGMMFRYSNMIQVVGAELQDGVNFTRTSATDAVKGQYIYNALVPIETSEGSYMRYVSGTYTINTNDNSMDSNYFYTTPIMSKIIEEQHNIKLNTEDKILLMDLVSVVYPDDYYNVETEIIINYMDIKLRWSGEKRLTVESVYEGKGDPIIVDNTPDMDFSEWIVTAIGGFMDFSLFPGLTIGSMFAVVAGMGILMMVIKWFAGG